MKCFLFDQQNNNHTDDQFKQQKDRWFIYDNYTISWKIFTEEKNIFWKKLNNQREKSLRIKISGMNYFDLVSI